VTHTGIKDPDLRAIMASELLTFRRLRKEEKIDLKSDYYFGAIVGFETALRRVQLWRKTMTLNEKIARLKELTLIGEDRDEFLEIWKYLTAHYQEEEGFTFSGASNKVWQICEDARKAQTSGTPAHQCTFDDDIFCPTCGTSIF